jgi:CheY-like chemotaxis protein
LAVSGVETVNLAFVEGPFALESPMEFAERVLIVDDEPKVVGVLLDFFAHFQHGHAYDVVPAYSAAEARDVLLRGAFDLILLDMVIPGIGAGRKQGLDLLKPRRTGRAPRAPRRGGPPRTLHQRRQIPVGHNEKPDFGHSRLAPFSAVRGNFEKALIDSYGTAFSRPSCQRAAGGGGGY